jgi:hypothetical protein
VPDKRGGLNGSTQHHLEVRLQESQQLESFASADSSGTPSWLGVTDYSRTFRFSYREALSDQQLKECCIDRLSWQRLPEKWKSGQNAQGLSSTWPLVGNGVGPFSVYEKFDRV